MCEHMRVSAFTGKLVKDNSAIKNIFYSRITHLIWNVSLYSVAVNRECSNQ